MSKYNSRQQLPEDDALWLPSEPDNRLARRKRASAARKGVAPGVDKSDPLHIPPERPLTAEEAEIAKAPPTVESQLESWQRHNLRLAKLYAKAGYYVIPVCGKGPILPAWPTADTALTKAEKAEIVAKYRKTHGRDPLHVGSTRSRLALDRIWKARPDCLPGLPCGPNGIFNIDIDVKTSWTVQPEGRKKLTVTEKNGRYTIVSDGETRPVSFDGKRLQWSDRHGDYIYPISKAVLTSRPGMTWFDELIRKHPRVLDGAVVAITPSGGRHLIFANPPGDDHIKSTRNIFGEDDRVPYNVDLLSDGRQFVAPGALREDGKRYINDPLFDALILATGEKNRELSKVPAILREQIARHGNDTVHEKKPAAPGCEVDAEHVIERCRRYVHGIVVDEGPIASQRHEKFGRCAAMFGDFGLSEDAAVDLILELNGDENIVDSPLADDDELADYARRMHRARQSAVGCDYKKPHIASDGSDLPPVPDEDDTTEKAKKAAKSPEAPDAAAYPLQLSNEIAATWKAPRWLVKNLIPRHAIGLLYGAPKQGKTFAAIDLAHAIDQGREWLAWKTKQFGTLYFAAEGVETLDNRVTAIEREKGEGRIGIVKRVPNLFSDKNAHKSIIAAAETYKVRTGRPVGLVILDTFAAITAGIDENKAGEITVVMDQVRKVVDALDCTVLILHHEAKNSDGSPRGSTALLGAVDFSIRVANNQILPAAMRDSPSGKGARCPEFRLRSVVLGKDDDGDDVSTCVIDLVAVSEGTGFTDTTKPTKRETRRDGTTGEVLAAARAVSEAAAVAAGVPSTEAPFTKAAVLAQVNAVRLATDRDEMPESTARAALDRSVKAGVLEEVAPPVDKRRKGAKSKTQPPKMYKFVVPPGVDDDEDAPGGGP